MSKQTDEVLGNLINGQWVTGTETFDVFNKYTGDVIAKVTKSSREDVSDAIGNAAETFKTAKLTPYQRYEILMKAADLFKQRKKELALTIVREGGKVLKDALMEIERGIQTFIASAEEAKRLQGHEVPIQGQPGSENKMAFTLRVPVGVLCAITPFNFPFNLVAHKVAPALAAGNTVILKPAGVTPQIAAKMAEILLEAGLPPGFLNVVNGPGREIGQYLMEDARISMYTFTGSTEVGKQIKASSGIRKVTLELGSNSPNIVHKDAPDLAKAAELCVRRGFVNAGQACISVQRIYVHEDVYAAFVDKSIEVASSLLVGDPELEATDIGPMISVKEAERAEQWIQEAVQQGATIAHGGQRTGAVLVPTILTNTLASMKVMCQEVFAPVICITSYSDINEAFLAANDSNYGLQAGIFTSDLQLAFRAARELEFGGVIINDVSTFRADIMPYGGVKDSGYGKEGPRYAIQEMTNEKLVVFDI
ncbi:Acyl-CoA reductase [Paenibacillus sp. 1_12]|uniref:aldehyde dehydrogenase family protein n=1 Tax=Paenibacillus sp. 1_12 TaxID=1566278 RepID=UPI0008E28C66|nr:aldehyde dehydrogenase family protein [Paenibacillus sp. 1_12]SFK99693.1 Acyl-CoA reductase [Paenibacillus sp. 1_12]